MKQWLAKGRFAVQVGKTLLFVSRGRQTSGHSYKMQDSESQFSTRLCFNSNDS